MCSAKRSANRIESNLQAFLLVSYSFFPFPSSFPLEEFTIRTSSIFRSAFRQTSFRFLYVLERNWVDWRIIILVRIVIIGERDASSRASMESLLVFFGVFLSTNMDYGLGYGLWTLVSQ